METAIYLRVSSKTQREWTQEPDLRRWSKANAPDAAWYRDVFTGTSMERPAFSRLLAEVQLGRVGTIVVWRLDRLGRTAKGLAELVEVLARRKVNLVSLKEGLDLATPAGRLMAHVLASVAAYETEVRSERQLAGIAEAKARGVAFGRPKGPGKPLKVNDDKREMVVGMRAAGKPIAAIARAAGLTRQTVYRVLEGVADGRS